MTDEESKAPAMSERDAVVEQVRAVYSERDLAAFRSAIAERDAEIARLRSLLSPAAIVSRPACATCLRAWDVCVCERTP